MGNRQSFAARQRERLAMTLESNEAAEERTAEQRKDKKKDNIQQMVWDKHGLKIEVENYDNEAKVNWSSLARKYGVKNSKGENAKIGGQIVYQYLVNEGVNVKRFKRKHSNDEDRETKIRRKKLKGLGGWLYLCLEISMNIYSMISDVMALI